MTDVDRAIENLANIKSQIAASRMFRGFGPLIIALTGALALCVAALQYSNPDRFAATDIGLLGIWVGLAVIAGMFIGLEMLSRTKRHHGALAESMTQQALETFLPVGIVGAIIGAVVWQFAPDIAWALPGVWQLLISMGVFASVKFLPKPILFVAAFYFFAGVIVLIFGAHSRSISPWAMGLPFAGGQLLMALILHFALEHGHDR